jgi:arylsulfatase
LTFLLASATSVSFAASPNATSVSFAASPNATSIVHDAEYYVLEPQNGKAWSAEDRDLDARLAELREKFDAPPNIVHIM